MRYAEFSVIASEERAKQSPDEKLLRGIASSRANSQSYPVRTRNDAFILSLIICLLLISFFSSATDYASCRSVYNNLVKAIGRFDPPAPVIVFRNSPTLTAEIKPNGEIHVGSKFVEACRKMEHDSLNAMALVLAHELAHHYQNHFWAKEYGTAYADVEWGKKVGSTFKDMKDMGVYESQADEFGLFYAYVAGYNTLGLAGSLYEKIYREFQLPDSLPGYPALGERKKIAEKSEERVKRLIPVFEAGKLLTILSSVKDGEYKQYLLGKASECFEKIVDEKFTSREIFNNLGVAQLLMAIGLQDDDENKFRYPVMIDDESRLYDTKETTSSTKGGLGFSDEEMKRLLDAAEKYFNHAKDLDKNYLPAYINLACVHDLRKEYEDAEFVAGKAVKIANETGKPKMVAYAMEIQAIVLTHMEDKKGAEKKFTEAKDAGSLLSEYNLAVLSGKALTDNKQPIKLSLSNKEELIDNKSMYEIISETEYSSENLYKLRGESRVIKVDENKADLFVIECTDADCPFQNVVFYQIHGDYDKPTARGINLYDSLQKVTDAYGKANQIVPSGNSDYHVFAGSNIIFKIVGGKVTGWAIYYHV